MSYTSSLKGNEAGMIERSRIKYAGALAVTLARSK